MHAFKALLACEYGRGCSASWAHRTVLQDSIAYDHVWTGCEVLNGFLPCAQDEGPSAAAPPRRSRFHETAATLLRNVPNQPATAQANPHKRGGVVNLEVSSLCFGFSLALRCSATRRTKSVSIVAKVALVGSPASLQRTSHAFVASTIDAKLSLRAFSLQT